MALYDDFPLTEFDRKALAVLGEHAVLKYLGQQTAFQRLPRYVSEYLIAKYVRPESWREDVAKIEAKIRELLPDQEHKELLKEKLLGRGEVTLIDYVEVRVDLKNGQRWATIRAINDNSVRVDSAIVEQNVGLLLGGMWGTARLRYAPEVDARAPIELVSFTPFQVGPPDIAWYRGIRDRFTTDEWIGLMLQSCGYSANAYSDRRTKLLLLARLVPLAQRNVNMIELGPRQTGKTFLLRNLSHRVFTVSGGKTTPANLFVHGSTGRVGIIGTRKVIVFDEIANTQFDDRDQTIAILKDYMESGQFSRMKHAISSDASLVFAGNLNVLGNQPDTSYRHHLEELPGELIDAAFQDRIHGYLPGWEYPKMTPASIATGVGLVTDYFGETITKLREDDFMNRVRGVAMHPNLTQRDRTAVERIGSGLIKILYPNGVMTDEELVEVVCLASELRQRVHKQLCAIAPGEFKYRVIGPTSLQRHEARDLQPRPSNGPEIDDKPQIGRVYGLSVLSDGDKTIGGAISEFQARAINGSPGTQVTGMHGSVMRDSVRAVYNLIRANCTQFGIRNDDLASKLVALHLVRMAEPKDGPSAGLAFLVAMVSTLSNRPIRPGFAFTGEVALMGDIGAVGGMIHKLRAAADNGIRDVVMPVANLSVLNEMPDEIAEAVNLHPVAHAREAIDLALLPR